MDSARAADIQTNRFAQLRLACEIVETEGQALVALSKRLGDGFCDAVDLLYQAQANVIVSGMGKAGLIGQKIAATLASTGTRSHFLHPAEAVHGDLGRIASGDVVLMLSQSGETSEVTQLLPSLAALNTELIAITGNAGSTLAQAAHVTLDLGVVNEVCPLRLAPSTSTTAMLAIGDALALVVSQMRGFRREDFARFHPGGSLGRKLSRVDQQLRPIDQCRVARETLTARQVFIEHRRSGRRSGAVMLVDEQGRLTGIFTDSDLARLFESAREAQLDLPISELMTKQPAALPSGSLLSVAVDLMAQRKISELPIIDRQGAPIGMIDITDIVSLMPQEDEENRSAASPQAALSEDPTMSPRVDQSATLPFQKNPRKS